jgi:hypothetical protein
MHILMTMTTSLFLLPDACFLVLCASFRYTMLIATVLASDLGAISVVWRQAEEDPQERTPGSWLRQRRQKVGLASTGLRRREKQHGDSI